jgi:hypothetical protein
MRTAGTLGAGAGTAGRLGAGPDGAGAGTGIDGAGADGARSAIAARRTGGACGTGGKPTPGACCADDAADTAAPSMQATATVDAPCMLTNLPSWVGDLTRTATRLRRSTVTIST